MLTTIGTILRKFVPSQKPQLKEETVPLHEIYMKEWGGGYENGVQRSGNQFRLPLKEKSKGPIVSTKWSEWMCPLCGSIMSIGLNGKYFCRCEAKRTWGLYPEADRIKLV